MSAVQSRSSRPYRRLAAQVRARRDPCYICGKTIDYSLKYPDKKSFSTHHILSWSTHPHLRMDPENVVAAHLDCNQGAPQGGSQPAEPAELGQRSREW